MNVAKRRRRMAAQPLASPKPPPLWVTTDSADYARTALSRGAAARHEAEAAALAKAKGGLVAEHPAQYVGDPHTTGAKQLEALAKAKGLRTNVIVDLWSCTVEGIDVKRGIGFRMTWTRGRADSSGTWHESRVKYDHTFDERPAHDAKVARTVKGKVRYIADPNRMPKGLARMHLTIVATPAGVPLNLTAIKAKLNGLEP